MLSLLPALKFSLIERYSGSYVLCPYCVLLIYPPCPHPLYLNLSPYSSLDHSYSLQSSQHYSLVLVRLVAYAACRNYANLNLLSP
ncbi:hypothetical protein HBH50_088220 [Parastagonospora nodorum]|nr:hypothetical protein HBH50_088220 [Parastagonospora nodorum]KAH4092987.1 hypothetical protein HBH48_075160 [Parastagonospora nodorum]